MEKSTLTPPNHTYHFVADWFTSNIPIWEKLLKDYKGKPNLNFLEIGSFEGKSATWLLENILTAPSSRITCVDPFYETVHLVPEITVDKKEVTLNTWEAFLKNTAPFQDQIDVHRGLSHEILRQLPLNAYDFIYIDGSHDSLNVLEDSVLAFRLLKPGGILIWDDYEWTIFNISHTSLRHPKPAINAFLQMYDEKVECIHKAYQVAIRKLEN